VQFLLDANLPRSMISVVQRAGHACTHVRDTAFAAASDAQIAAHARTAGLTLVTRDLDFGDVRNYPPEQYAGLVVFRLPDTATAVTICQMAERFLAQTSVIAAVPGRLAVVEFGRLRLRPPIESLSS
jgi:predicted nuclease of predicted toxin-antitoxin system